MNDAQEGTDMPSIALTWSVALEALEADVEALDRALRDGSNVAVSSWQPPTDLGPVPEDLAPRAERLLRRISEVRGRGTERLGELQGELHELDRRRDASVAYAAAGGDLRTN
jgi:hypothetical protein